MRHLFLTALALVASSTLAWAEPSPDVIRVSVTGFRNDTGHLGCALFDRSNGFPFADAKAMRLQDVRIEQGRGECSFAGLPKGAYAIAVMHDENNNAKLDTNFFGIPTEGFGFSNKARAHTFSPASFEEARFFYSGGALTSSIVMIYR